MVNSHQPTEAFSGITRDKYPVDKGTAYYEARYREQQILELTKRALVSPSRFQSGNRTIDRLDRSKHLIVVASPEATRSHGMEMEARHWFTHSGTDRF